ncbi:acyl-CoA dehydrogenase/oxidase [Aspergillus unguis]
MSVAVPFSEPPWLNGHPSPYYTPSHIAWQKTCREFIENHLAPHAQEWENEGNVPEHVFETFSRHNMLIPNLPAPLPLDLLKSLGITELLGGLRIDDFDYFHFAIYISEMRRLGVGGPTSSLSTGMAYGMPPVIAYGSEELKQRLLPDLIRGKKRICIAITEPGAGSDVANIATTAVKSQCGRFYVVNGEKKWITNGVWSHYATMAVRTGGPGAKGLSLLVVPLLGHPGVTMRRMKTSGGSTSGTTFIDLEDVKVPVENLIGNEGEGMKMITRNFNHERLAISIGVVQTARVALSSAFAYVLKREAFGNPLIEQAVVRNRIARCGGELEALSAWMDQLVYTMDQARRGNNASVAGGPSPLMDLGGLLALAKARAGMVLDECARCAVLLFGGNGYTRTGQGELVEKIYREVPAARVPGGSEDVMLDLAVRQLVKGFRARTKALGRQKL